jgi:hypothetical protein
MAAHHKPSLLSSLNQRQNQERLSKSNHPEKPTMTAVSHIHAQCGEVVYYSLCPGPGIRRERESEIIFYCEINFK